MAVRKKKTRVTAKQKSARRKNIRVAQAAKKKGSGGGKFSVPSHQRPTKSILKETKSMPKGKRAKPLKFSKMSKKGQSMASKAIASATAQQIAGTYKIAYASF